MSYRTLVGTLTLLILGVFLVFGLTACPAPSADTPDNPAANGDGPDVEEPVVEEPTEPAEEDPNAEMFREMIGGRDHVTPEVLDTITMYGAIAFPGAEIDSDNSYRQEHPGDVEIYRLAFNVDTELEPVADWYSDNLEPDTVEGTMELPSEVTAYTFNYQSPDGMWTKDITVQGIVGEGRCQITVLILQGMNPPTGEEEAGGVDTE